jgi:hypothetical protein
MPVWVLQIRQGFAATVCGVDADELQRDPTSLRLYKDGELVYSAPAKQVLTCQECADRTEAYEVMRAIGRASAGKGALGPELDGIRPAAGGKRQVGHMVERVIAVTADKARGPSE